MRTQKPNHLPERIVSLQPSATVTLAHLGALERVVACTKYCAEVCPEAVRGRSIVADSWSAKSQEILAAKPDLVIAAVPYQLEAVAEILKAGVRFLALAPRTLNNIYSDMAMIAAIVGESERGEQMIERMQREIEDVRKKTSTASPVRVFCEEWGKPIITSQPWVAEMIAACGGEFVGETGMQQSAETVLKEDPDVIIAAWCGAGDRVPLEKIVRSRGWEKTTAGRGGRIFCIRDEYLNTPAITLLDGLRALAWALHPELFAKPAGIRRIGEAADAGESDAYALMKNDEH